MASSVSSWLVPVLLTVGSLFLVMNILNARKTNKSLVDDIERARSDVRVAMDTSQDCSKKLDANTADMTAKDQQLASLNADVKTLTEEKNKIQEELIQLQAQLDGPAQPAEAPKEEAPKVEEKPAEAA
eukprot:GFUD01070698.1.p1 GENE.GFUD01070698.1~~GFUD01070698.1.p1  ORF type:complete len:128 (+),score=59.91 GFUD01070698.1:116-499(+)